MDSDSISLDDLPDDVIRRIIPTVGAKAAKCLQFISFRWHALVNEYLMDRTLHPSMEIVRIREDWKGSVDVSARVNPRDVDYFRRSLWKRANCSRYSAEILSPSFYLRNFSRKCALICGIIMLITITTAFGFMINALHNLPSESGPFYRCLVSISQLIVALAIIWAVNRYSEFGKTIQENRERMAKVFARCGSIDKLILLRLDTETLSVVRDSLSDINISHLTMVTKKDDVHLRRQIIEMTRVHKIKEVAVCVEPCDGNMMRNFLIDVSDDVEADVVEFREDFRSVNQRMKGNGKNTVPVKIIYGEFLNKPPDY